MSAAAAPVEASRARRALAALIDAAPILVFVAASLRRQWRNPNREPPGRHFNRVNRAVSLVLEAMRACGASPGARLAGTVVGDRVTGRRVSVPRAVARIALDQAPSVLASRALARERERTAAARSAILAELRRREPGLRGDPRAMGEERMRALRGRRLWPTFAKQTLIAQTLRWLLAPLRRRVHADYVTLERASV